MTPHVLIDFTPQPWYPAGTSWDNRVACEKGLMKTEWKIERGVKMPTRRQHATKYPFEEMAVGDSFEMPHEQVARIRSAAAAWGKDHSGAKFAVRIMGTTARIWRIN